MYIKFSVFFLYTNVHIFFTPYINTFENYKNVRPVLKKTHQTNKEKQNKNKHWALLRLNLKKKKNVFDAIDFSDVTWR